MSLGASNEYHTTSGHHRCGIDQSEDLISLEELLQDAWNAQGPASTGSKEICLSERSAGDVGHIAKNDCNEALHPGSRQGASRGRSPRFRRR